MGLGPRVLGRPVELGAECVGCQQSPMRFPQHCAPEEDCVCRAVGENPFCLLRMLNQANGAGPYARFPANSLSEADLIAGRQSGPTTVGVCYVSLPDPRRRGGPLTAGVSQLIARPGTLFLNETDDRLPCLDVLVGP